MDTRESSRGLVKRRNSGSRWAVYFLMFVPVHNLEISIALNGIPLYATLGLKLVQPCVHMAVCVIIEGI
jgi:hypothetical protein